MFETVFRRRAAPPPSSLVEYLGALYLQSAREHPDIASKVYVGDDGTIAGFIGTMAIPMQIDGRIIMAAMCSSMMVDPDRADPTLAGRLMRAVRQGPQDLSFAETASAVSVAMWKGLRGIVLPQYSLDWLRVFSPLQFAIDLGRTHLPLPGMLAGLAAPLDAAIRRRRLGPQSWRWVEETSPHRDEALDREQTASLIRNLAASFRLAPDWPAGTLERMLDDAARKSTVGEMTSRAVTTADGKPVGIFIYHGRRKGVGRVLQLLAIPNQTGAVIDRMFAHAAAGGLVALRGRASPALLHAMSDRHFVFTSRASTGVAPKDPAIMSALVEGKALLNGLAGETWTRLNGDTFV